MITIPAGLFLALVIIGCMSRVLFVCAVVASLMMGVIGFRTAPLDLGAPHAYDAPFRSQDP